MREFTIDDGFTLSEILDKTGFEFDLNAFADAAKEKEDKDKQAYLGGQMILSLMKKIHLAKDATIKLMSDMSEEPVADVKKWGIAKIKEFFSELIQQGGLKDFFS
jgi:hypothetical protein